MFRAAFRYLHHPDLDRNLISGRWDLDALLPRLFAMDAGPRIAKILPFSRANRPGMALQSQPTARTRQAFEPLHSRRGYCPLWWLIAWTVAAARVRLAVSQREIFGLDASLAFLIAVVLPICSAGLLFDLARRALRPLQMRIRRHRHGALAQDVLH